MTTITARIDDKLIEQLTLIAEKTERSRSYLIRKAIENFILDSQEEIEEQYWMNHKTISSEDNTTEINSRIEKLERELEKNKCTK